MVYFVPNTRLFNCFHSVESIFHFCYYGFSEARMQVSVDGAQVDKPATRAGAFPVWR